MNVIGAITRRAFFLPILSTILAPKNGPMNEPNNGANAHHDASVLVVGIEDELDSKYGMYGELHPVFAPSPSPAKEAEIKITQLT